MVVEPSVALRKESVDRNLRLNAADIGLVKVALRKESVDRNSRARCFLRRAPVALRKESVDRNDGFVSNGGALDGRSPQGERG